MASAPLNWLLKIGGDALQTTAQTLSAAVNELKGLFASVNNMGDVDINTPTDGQNMAYDATAGKWKNVTPAPAVSNLSELGDVELTNIADGQLIEYRAATQKFVNTIRMMPNGSNAADLVHFPKKFAAGGGYAETTTFIRNTGKTSGDFYFKYSERNSSKTIISGIPKTLFFGPTSQYPNANYPYVNIGTPFTSFNTTEYHDLHRVSGSPTGQLYNISSYISSQYDAYSGEGDDNNYNIAIILKLVDKGSYYDLTASATGFRGDIGVSGDPVIFYASGASINFSSLKTTAAPMKATGNYSFAHGYGAQATGNYSYAGGYAYDAEHPVVASGTASHAEGQSTTASGTGAHAEGYVTAASGNYSHAEGQSTTASGDNTHAEGANTRAIGIASHAEGASTAANGNYTHAEGSGTTASGQYSHAGGYGVQALRNASFVQGNSSGKFNDSAFTENHQHVFGIDMSAGQWSAAAEVEDAYNGCEGTIINDTTVTLDLETQGVYLLFQTAYTISNGAIYGTALNLIACHGLSTGTPVTVQLKTSTAPVTLTMLANNKISIRNAAVARATEFHLIRIQ